MFRKSGIKKPQKPKSDHSDLEELFNKILAAAKQQSTDTLTDLYLDEGLDISKIRIYGDTILSRMAYEINMHKKDMRDAALNHEFNTLINFYRKTTVGENNKQITDSDYQREILVGLIRLGDMQALDLDLMDEEFYLFTCGRFGLTDVISWFLIISLDSKRKNTNLQVTQLSDVNEDTKFIMDAAIKGYALGFFLQKVANFLTCGASMDNAAEGFAQGGYSDQVNKLLLLNASRDSALKGYISSGIFHKLEDLFSQGPDLIDKAVKHLKNKDYCFHLIFNTVDKKNPNCQRIIAGREKATLRIISSINNPDLRKVLLEKISQAGAHFANQPALLQKATQINQALQQGKSFDSQQPNEESTPTFKP